LLLFLTCHRVLFIFNKNADMEQTSNSPNVRFTSFYPRLRNGGKNGALTARSDVLSGAKVAMNDVRSGTVVAKPPKRNSSTHALPTRSGSLPREREGSTSDYRP
jgi:hypothetical protein